MERLRTYWCEAADHNGKALSIGRHFINVTGILNISPKPCDPNTGIKGAMIY